jgi:hypothetical protein
LGNKEDLLDYSQLKLIEVVNFDGTQRSVLFWKKLVNPELLLLILGKSHFFIISPDFHILAGI